MSELEVYGCIVIGFIVALCIADTVVNYVYRRQEERRWPR